MALRGRKYLSYAPEERLARARKQIELADKHVGLRGQRVLEVGCYHGDISLLLAEEYDCEVVGLDIRTHANWDSLNSHPRISVLEASIIEPHDLLSENSFDRIISFVVWEHIRHPWSALKVCQRVLRPSGKKFLRANLYRSALASHLYRQIDEPWPQLLYSANEIKEKFGIEEISEYFWCNKLTYQQYLFYFRQLGFYISHESFDGIKFDNDFYEDNENILGLYPKWDLEKDFFNVALEFDLENPKKAIKDPIYRLKK